MCDPLTSPISVTSVNRWHELFETYDYMCKTHDYMCNNE